MLAWAKQGVLLDPVRGPWLGVARTLIALGTLGTLALTPTSALFNHLRFFGQAPFCDGLAAVSIFCIGSSQLGLIRAGAIAILLVVAIGWLPAWTAVPHWWVSFSVFQSVGLPDGGDQIAMILSGLLIPVLIFDSRTWHWQRASAEPDGARAAITWTAVWAIRLQISFLYLQAGISKLYVPEWRDGTALYYWSTNVMFGASSTMEPVARAIYNTPFLMGVLGGFTILLELVLGVAILLPPRVRHFLFPLGLVLHFSIGVAIGLWSFAFIMFGALVLLLTPLGRVLPWRRLVSTPRDSKSPEIKSHPVVQEVVPARKKEMTQ